MSFPLFGETFDFTQPDGTKFKVRAWGDQEQARFETPEGIPVVQNPATGFYHHAAIGVGGTLQPAASRVGIESTPHGAEGISAGGEVAAPTRPTGSVLLRPRWKERWEQQKAAQKMESLSDGVLAAPPARQTVGEYLGLCLLIDFADEPHMVSRDEVDAFCNQEGYSGGGNHGSVYDYYRDNSGGKLHYRTVVAPWYRASQPKTYYTDPSIAYGVRAQELIAEALKAFKAQHFDFSKLTVDERGGVYATNVFYSGEVENNWSQGMWPHASRLATPISLAPGVNAVDYQVTALSSTPVLGTYCHENGHMLCDFPDLYQYSNQRLGVGEYCLMCGGGNADKLNPTNICAYLKYRAGWGQTTAAAAGQAVTLEAGSNQFLLHTRGDEYFILEYRQRKGRDAALPSEGLAVWHVDELGSNSNPNDAPVGHRRHEVSLVQADGRPDLDSGANQGDATDLFGTTSGAIFRAAGAPSSRWFDGTDSRLSVSDVSVAAGRLQFKVL